MLRDTIGALAMRGCDVGVSRQAETRIAAATTVQAGFRGHVRDLPANLRTCSQPLVQSQPKNSTGLDATMDGVESEPLNKQVAR